MSATVTESKLAKETKDRDALAECPDCLAGNLSWLLSQVNFALATEIGATLEPVGLSPRSYHVLAAAVTGPHTQKELADLVGVDKTTMVVTLDELEAAGLAERIPSPTDRRARVVSATAAGERKVKEARKLVEGVQSDVLGSLPAKQREALLASLGTLAKDRLSEPVDCAKPMRRREPRS